MDYEKEYYFRFGKFPPVNKIIDSSDEKYQNLLKDSIEKGKEITFDEIDELYGEYDEIKGRKFSSFDKPNKEEE